MITTNKLGLLLGIFVLTLAGCDSANLDDSQLDDSELAILDADSELALSASKANQKGRNGHGRNEHLSAGAVYTMTNAADGNVILVYGRAANGRLTSQHSYRTGGLGSGDGLNGTSNPLILSDDNRYLFAVNGGSNDLSVFKRNGRTLKLMDTVSSQGERPVSVTTNGDLVYVLNVGGSNDGNISGFRMRHGTLQHIVTRPVNAGGADLPQIGFSPDGRFLVITDKPTNTITTYVVDHNGIAGLPNTQASSGQTPFGFDITRDNILFVSEAFGGASDASAASTYRIHADGSLESISPVVLTTETAACWAETTANGRFGYVTNTGSSSVTGYAIDPDGALTLLDADGVTASTGMGAGPVDLVIIGNSLMYVHSKGTDEIRGFKINQHDGSLTPIASGNVGNLPSTTVGVAAF